MVLVEVGQFVVEKNRGLEVCWDLKLDYALLLLGYVRHSIVVGIVQVCIARSVWPCVAVRSGEVVRVLVGG